MLMSVWNDTEPILTTLQINGRDVQLEVDTGACRTIVNEGEWRRIAPEGQVKPSTLKLKSFTGEVVPILGEGVVEVSINNKSYGNLNLVFGKVPGLFGRDSWLKLNLTGIKYFVSHLHNLDLVPTHPTHHLSNQAGARLRETLEKHGELFSDGLAAFKGSLVNIYKKEGAQPAFLKARPVPYAVQEKVELDRMVREGMLNPVDHSRWGSSSCTYCKEGWISQVMRRLQSDRQQMH